MYLLESVWVWNFNFRYKGQWSKIFGKRNRNDYNIVIIDITRRGFETKEYRLGRQKNIVSDDKSAVETDNFYEWITIAL